MKEEKDALDRLIDSLLAERKWQLFIENLEKTQAPTEARAKQELRRADSPKSSDRQTWFDQNKEREGTTYLSVERLSRADIEFLKSRHRPKVAPEPPIIVTLPPALDPILVT